MSAPVLTLFEHQTCPYTQIAPLAAHPARRERVLAALERVNLAAGQEILQVGRTALRTRAWVGILRAGDLTVEILPKIGQAAGSGGPQPSAAVRNLMVMLGYVFDLRILEQDTAGLASSAGAWFSALTRLFVADLSRQAAAGLAQHYIQREERLPALRGRWDIQRQIQRPGPPHLGFDAIYDEYTPDTPLNQVFRYAIERLRQVKFDPANRAGLENLHRAFAGVTCPTSISPAHLEGIRFDRLNERFRPAFNLARLLLAGQILQLPAGAIPAGGFVLDMNTLFERFMAAFIDRHRAAILPAGWQGVGLRPQSAGLPLYLATSAGQPALRLRPDLLFTRGRTPETLLFADTKYKKLSVARGRPALAPEDAYQMLAYGVRLGCPRGLLLYPQPTPAGPCIRQRLTIQAAGLELIAATVNLHLPLDEPARLVQELREIFALAGAPAQPAGG